MQKYFNNVILPNGRPGVSETVTVTDYPAGTASTIYSDDGVTLIVGNTVTTDSLGYFEFYAADGHYTITISGSDILTKTIDDIILEDPGDANAVTVSTLTSTSYVDVGNGGHSFTIAGSALNGKLSVHDDSATDVLGVTIERHENTTAAFGAHFVGARTRGTEASKTIVQSGDLITRFLGLGFDGTDYATAAEIKIEVDGTPGAGDMPGRIVFETTPDGTETMVERMRITNAGLVGIGTGSTTPDGTVHVMTASAGTVTANANADDLVVENSGAAGISILSGTTAGIYLGASTNNRIASISANSSAFYVSTGVAGSSLIFRSGAFVEAMRSDGNQNISIGTAAISTTATNGFLYIPTCAGAPTGTPTAKTGLAPMVYDSTNNKFWMYDGGWIGVALA